MHNVMALRDMLSLMTMLQVLRNAFSQHFKTHMNRPPSPQLLQLTATVPQPIRPCTMPSTLRSVGPARTTSPPSVPPRKNHRIRSTAPASNIGNLITCRRVVLSVYVRVFRKPRPMTLLSLFW
jgi:hypothetical protein